MSRIRIVKGNTTKITGGNHNMYSNESIITNSNGKITETAEQGVVYGEPEVYNHTATCTYTPNTVAQGDKNYYIRRFTDFMKRHANCSHVSPVYYYGELKEMGKLSRQQELSLVTIGVHTGQSSYKKRQELEAKQMEEDKKSSYQYTKNRKKVIPLPNTSYGFKYCDRFTQELHPNLTQEGKKWLDQAKKDLQTYMERVINKSYIAVYNKSYNEVI